MILKRLSNIILKTHPFQTISDSKSFLNRLLKISDIKTTA